MIRKFLYYFSDFLIYRTDIGKFYQEYKFIKRNLHNSLSRNKLIQKERLFTILDFAIKNIPYYKELAKERNINLSKNTIFNDIRQFPILTKEIIRENWNSLHVNLDEIKYAINTSGGTTGEPIKIVQDRSLFLEGNAATRVFNEIGQYFVGDRLVMLWGNERDYLRDSKGILNVFLNGIRSITFQNAFKMSDPILLKFIREINYKKPHVLLGYIQSVYMMAKYIKRKSLKIHQLDSIIVSAGVLSKEMKNFIESVFGCQVYDRYGSREMGILATSCEKSDKLHINMFQKYVEILDKSNNPLTEHETGNIIITSLINYSMPLIRYKIGDRGSLDLTQCPCGIGLTRLDKVIGRVVDVFKTQNGELIDGEYFTHLLYFRENVKKFQIVQESLNQIDVYLVSFDGGRLNSVIEAEITQKIKLVMGSNCQVNFNYVPDISSAGSGKMRFTISKV